MLMSGAAWPDVPRLELGVGQWDHDVSGTLGSDDPLLAVPAGFELDSDRESYARFGVRLGSAWWAPVVRGRYTQLSGEGSGFEDNSTFLGNILINLDTTSTRTATTPRSTASRPHARSATCPATSACSTAPRMPIPHPGSATARTSRWCPTTTSACAS